MPQGEAEETPFTRKRDNGNGFDFGLSFREDGDPLVVPVMVWSFSFYTPGPAVDVEIWIQKNNGARVPLYDSVTGSDPQTAGLTLKQIRVPANWRLWIKTGALPAGQDSWITATWDPFPNVLRIGS